MQGINIVLKDAVEEKLRAAENAPGKIALQGEAHVPGIEPIRDFSLTDTLAHELVDGILQCHNIILQCKKHETHGRKSKQTGNSNDQIWPESFFQEGSGFQSFISCR